MPHPGRDHLGHFGDGGQPHDGTIASNHATMFAGPLQITMDITRVDVSFLDEEFALVTAS